MDFPVRDQATAQADDHLVLNHNLITKVKETVPHDPDMLSNLKI